MPWHPCPPRPALPTSRNSFALPLSLTLSVSIVCLLFRCLFIQYAANLKTWIGKKKRNRKNTLTHTHMHQKCENEQSLLCWVRRRQRRHRCQRQRQLLWNFLLLLISLPLPLLLSTNTCVRVSVCVCVCSPLLRPHREQLSLRPIDGAAQRSRRRSNFWPARGPHPPVRTCVCVSLYVISAHRTRTHVHKYKHAI